MADETITGVAIGDTSEGKFVPILKKIEIRYLIIRDKDASYHFDTFVMRLIFDRGNI